MSRIIDSVLRPYVEKYQYNTIDEWEYVQEIQSMIAEDKIENDLYYELTEEDNIKYAAEQRENS